MHASPVVSARREEWPSPATHGLLGLSVLLVLVVVGASVVVGADTMWTVALGRWTVEHSQIPVGVPFATAPSVERSTPVLLGALVLTAAHAMGPLALAVLLILIDAIVLGLLSRAFIRAGRSPVLGAIVVVLVAAGSIRELGVVRLPMLSLLPFTLLVLLLIRQEDRADRGLWLAVPLIALWANLHGGFVIGIAVLGAFLVGRELRRAPRRAIGVGMAAVAAPLATPAGWQVVPYLVDTFGNEAARRGSDLWASPTLSSGFDALMMAGGLVAVGIWAIRRPPPWEWLLVGGLAVATSMASRNSVWLLLATAFLIASASGRGPEVARERARVWPILLVISLGAAGSVVQVVSRGPAATPEGQEIAARVIELSANRVLMAPEPLLETLAAEGARVWVCNPVDSFRRVDQAAFLDFLSGDPAGLPAVINAEVLVLRPGTDQEKMAEGAGFRRLRTMGGYAVWERQPRS